ncbi:hypothetical protein [Paracoccus pacificus]|uniref:HdeA/HdeB family protein n=1 Tax=Paracoccus pacificus TaxID=1463598 RepID=A0ABW4R9R3_9RHOB
MLVMMTGGTAMADDLHSAVAARMDVYDRAIACLKTADFSGDVSSDLDQCDQFHDEFKVLMDGDKLLYDNDLFCLARSLNAMIADVKMQEGDLSVLASYESDVGTQECRDFLVR